MPRRHSATDAEAQFPALGTPEALHADRADRAPERDDASSILEVGNVSHAFGAFKALDGVSVALRSNEIVALLGPSGCGKSTLLRTIAGFVRQSSGEVRIDGRVVDGLRPGARNIGIVFQNYALFPHLSVFENIAYGLRARGVSRAEIGPRVASALETVRMAALAGRSPRQLSGGQQQRVAIARALVTQPRLILLDEPFAALDKHLRLEMQAEVKRLQREQGLTAILVTHDQDEAMSVADRVAVMRRGRIEQIDTPARIYDRPATLFVNGFVGAANLLPGRVTGRAGGRCTVTLDARAILTLPDRPDVPVGGRVIVSVRPEHLLLESDAAPDRWRVELRARTSVGGTLREELQAEDGTDLVRLSTRSPGIPVPASTDATCCRLRDPECANLFPLD